MMSKVALICGITGQDGALLAKLLLEKDYQVWGTTRIADNAELGNLAALDLLGKIRLLPMLPEDSASVLNAFRQSRATEIYYLAGQSSVGRSFDIPAETFRGITLGTLNVLEAARMLDWPVRIFNAGSGECFGETGDCPATETTPFSPASPYAVAKASAGWLVRNYRENYSLHVCTGLLFNHESHLRPERFVTQKVIKAAKRISEGSKEELKLGRLDIWRDWGWAPEYVEAMWRVLQHSVPEDFVIASGQTCSLREFVAEAFAMFGLNWQEHVTESPELYRPSDIVYSRANPGKALRLLGWKAKYGMRDVVRLMSTACSEHS
jgi:GDPmannose 4,6-dehydratase